MKDPNWAAIEKKGDDSMRKKKVRKYLAHVNGLRKLSKALVSGERGAESGGCTAATA